jgi:ribosomal-protein-alanine N-acetyltransferase
MDSLRRHTLRLDLVPLSIQQLKWTLDSPKPLEENLGICFDAAIVDENVIRAIGMKLTKMAKLPIEKHIWQTYWLIVERDEKIGIGLVGFKSPPDDEGLSEVGYGIAPAWQNRGYMSEALRGLLDWAFEQPGFLGITATTVVNPASNRVLQKLGATLLEENENERSWMFRKESASHQKEK